MGLGRGEGSWGGAGKRGFRLLPLRAGVGGGDMGVLARNSLYFSQPAHVSFRRRTAAHASYPTDSCSQRAPNPAVTSTHGNPTASKGARTWASHRAKIVGRPALAREDNGEPERTTEPEVDPRITTAVGPHVVVSRYCGPETTHARSRHVNQRTLLFNYLIIYCNLNFQFRFPRRFVLWIWIPGRCWRRRQRRQRHQTMLRAGPGTDWARVGQE